MSLAAGQRLKGSGRSVYLVSGIYADTAWYRLYEGRKMFLNYRYNTGELYEAAEDEWSDVFIRLGPDSGQYEASERSEQQKLLRYEASQVLATSSHWFPRPIEWLDQSTFQEPVLIMSRPCGVSLRHWRGKQESCALQCQTIASEILDMLNSLHQRGQIAGGLSPDDFLIDETGRLFFLGTDRVLPQKQTDRLRQFFPPERYPFGFAAPEAFEPNGRLDCRSDLYAWASLYVFLLTGQDPIQFEDEDAGGCLLDPQLPELEARLEIAMQSHRLRGLSHHRYFCSKAECLSYWVRMIRWCLQADPDYRPSSVKQLRDGVSPRFCFSWKHFLLGLFNGSTHGWNGRRAGRSGATAHNSASP